MQWKCHVRHHCPGARIR
jgi:hypothetical protein